MSSNPLYVHLRGGENVGLSNTLVGLIAVGVAVVSAVLVSGLLYALEFGLRVYPFDQAHFFLAVVDTSLILAIPSSSFIATVLFVRNYASGDEFTLLKLTPLSASELRDSFVRASNAKLRWLVALGWGLLPQSILILALTLGPSIGLIDCLGCYGSVTSSYIEQGIIPALGIGAIFAALCWRLCQLAVQTGVWIGVQWRDQSLTVASLILLISWIIFVPLVYHLLGETLSYELPLDIMIIMAGIIVVVIPTLTRYVQQCAEEAIGSSLQS